MAAVSEGNPVADAINRVADALFQQAKATRAQVKVSERALAVSEDMADMQKANLAVTQQLEAALTMQSLENQEVTYGNG